MTSEEVIRYLLSFLGGGFVAAAGNWLYSSWSARRAREVEVLRNQLRLLYGPLFFYTSQNQEFFKLIRDIEDARGEFFDHRQWSRSEQTQQTLSNQHLSTLALVNRYLERVVHNNERIMDVLEKNWDLVDPSDVEIFSRFQVDYTRNLVEERERGAAGVPYSVVAKVGPIFFMRPDVIARVHATFERQRARLFKLTGVRSTISKVDQELSARSARAITDSPAASRTASG